MIPKAKQDKNYQILLRKSGKFEYLMPVFNANIFYDVINILYGKTEEV